MNVSIIYRMFQDSESSGKYRFGGKKPINGDKRRRCEEYGLKRSNYVRRKQTKVRYDTWRRQEMPTEEDDKLSNLHYTNFLGDKFGDHGAPYAVSNVNVKFCDCMREEDVVTIARDEFDDSELSQQPQVEYYDSLSDVSLGSGSDDETICDYYDPIVLSLQHPDFLYKQSIREESRFMKCFNDMAITETNKKAFDIVLKELEDSVYEEEDPHQPEEDYDYEAFIARICQELEDEEKEYLMNRRLERQKKRAYHEEEDSQIMPMKKARCDDETFNV